MSRVVALVGCLAVLYFLTTTGALADTCSVKIEEAVLVREGQSRYADAYTVRLSTKSEKPLDANVSFIPSNLVVSFHGLVNDVSALNSGTAFFVIAPHGRVDYMAVSSWAGPSVERTPCVGAEQVEVGRMLSLGTFDDSSARYHDMALPQVSRIIDATFVTRQTPIYPKDDVYACHTGTVRVVVNIGLNGEVLSVVGRTSGYPNLDAAALAAARASTFTPAHLEDGTPITMTYSIEYAFSLPADFIQRAGLKNCPPLTSRVSNLSTHYPLARVR